MIFMIFLYFLITTWIFEIAEIFFHSVVFLSMIILNVIVDIFNIEHSMINKQSLELATLKFCLFLQPFAKQIVQL